MLDGFNEVSDNVKNALIKEIGDFLLMNNVRLIISSRYDFRYDYGLMHQFKQLSIQQLSKANIEKYLNSCKVEKTYQSGTFRITRFSAFDFSLCTNREKLC